MNVFHFELVKQLSEHTIGCGISRVYCIFAESWCTRGQVVRIRISLPRVRSEVILLNLKELVNVGWLQESTSSPHSEVFNSHYQNWVELVGKWRFHISHPIPKPSNTRTQFVTIHVQCSTILQSLFLSPHSWFFTSFLFLLKVLKISPLFFGLRFAFMIQ